MDFLETLHQIPPEQKKVSLSSFVQEHFEDISQARLEGYSWHEIWIAFQTAYINMHLPVRSEASLTSSWNNEKSRRNKDRKKAEA